MLILSAAIICCSEEIPTPLPDDTESPEVPENPDNSDSGYVESVPDTIVFTNSQFIYYGDEIGAAESDVWAIKLYTDMELDIYGNPIGPGSAMQILINVAYDSEQSADPTLLSGAYREMMNSMDFNVGTFVSGYMTYLDIPGGRIEFAEATFFADVKEGTTEMDYDMLDEGGIMIEENPDGTFVISGVLVGKKYTKRYFTWTGSIEPENYVPEEIPNSTLKHDITGAVFAKGQLQDKGDSFYLMDQSYRCFLIYLVDESVDITSYRPSGSGFVLRMEILVPWETDIADGIPAGVYEMTHRNPDTSIDKDNIIPGYAIPGLPNVFAEWKLGGSWLYELKDGVWTDVYARIQDGNIVINRGEDGSHTISYDLTDCQTKACRIQGTTTLTKLETL